MTENNMQITGDEARVMMAALIQTSPAVQLYWKLSQISMVQPAKQPEVNDNAE